MRRSPFIVYVDETGDHGLENINPTAPVFALCAALYSVSDYLDNDLPLLTELKFRLWNHDNVVFHSRAIRRRLPPFEACKDPVKKGILSQEIADFFGDSKAVLIVAAINKPLHRATYAAPSNPYFLALQFVMERVFGHTRRMLQPGQEIVFVFESRGAKEDATLASWFNQIRDGENQWGPLPFRAQFASKQTNMVGLQVADLAAYPIARHVEHPNVDRADFRAVEPRIRRSPAGKVDGWGLKVFP
jgi:hypothetical protein